MQPTDGEERDGLPGRLVDDWEDPQDAEPSSDEPWFLLDEAEDDPLDEEAPWDLLGELDERVEWLADDYLLGRAMDDFMGVVTSIVIFCATVNGIWILPDDD